MRALADLRSAARELPPAPRAAIEASPNAALGFLSMLPLFALYEIGLRASGGATRNLAELLVSLPLSPLGDGLALARPLALLAVAAACAWSCFHVELGLGPRLFRIALEGLGGAIVLGPLLLVGLSFLGGFEALRSVQLPRAPVAPGLGQALLLTGGGAYEELVFRMGLQGLLFLLVSRTLVFWLPHPPSVRWCSEILAVLLSALVFAAVHLALFTQVLGPGGEPYHPGIFLWRVLAGLLLAALFRWRGPGVAAWTHALFNLALAIGAGPAVLL